MKLPVLSSPYSQINNLLYKSYLPKVINSAIEIGVFDVLSNRALSLEEIAKELHTDVHVTDALLRVLVTIDFMQKQDSAYSLTVLSEEYLVERSVVNQLSAIKMFSGSAGPFDDLTQALKGDIKPFHNKMWASEQTILAMEQEAKAGAIQAVVLFVKSIPGFSDAVKMCDFAGSTGYYSFALLQENVALHSHVYDLPEVCALAKELKHEEENFDRITYHDFDRSKDDSFGDGYDLFFSSHFLYECGVNRALLKFLKKVNKAMVTGGLFFSSHISPCANKDSCLTLALAELMTRAKGYPDHMLPVETLKNALREAGFGEFTAQQPNENVAFPVQLLSAKKIKEVE